MSARAAISYLRDQGATVRLDGGDLVIEGIDLTDALIGRLRALKAEIVAELSRPSAPSCCVCGDPHAPYGYGWSLRAPDAARWFCAAHRAEAEGVLSADWKATPSSTHAGCIDVDTASRVISVERNLHGGEMAECALTHATATGA